MLSGENGSSSFIKCGLLPFETRLLNPSHHLVETVIVKPWLIVGFLRIRVFISLSWEWGVDVNASQFMFF